MDDQLTLPILTTNAIWSFVSIDPLDGSALACAVNAGVWYSSTPSISSSWINVSSGAIFQNNLQWTGVSLNNGKALACIQGGNVFYSENPGLEGDANWVNVSNGVIFKTLEWSSVSLDNG